MAINEFAELAKRYEKQIADLESRLSEYEDDEEEVQSKGMLLEDPEDDNEECDCGEEDCPICCAEQEVEEEERQDISGGGWKTDDILVMDEDEFEPDEDGEYDEELSYGVDMGLPQDVFIGYSSRGNPGALLDSGVGLYTERMDMKKKMKGKT